MAWTSSNMFQQYVHDSLVRSVAFNLTSDTLKAAMYNNAITPDRTVSAAQSAYNAAGSQWLAANEQSNGGWAAGGVALSGVTLVPSAGIITLGAANTANSTAATLTNLFGCLIQDSTVSGAGVCFNYFGGANAVSAGIFTIVWNISGVFSIVV